MRIEQTAEDRIMEMKLEKLSDPEDESQENASESDKYDYWYLYGYVSAFFCFFFALVMCDEGYINSINLLVSIRNRAVWGCVGG